MIRIFVLTTALALCGCRDSAYSAASKTDTIEAWRHFLDANPKDQNADAATERLTELEFEQAKQAHTVLAYKRFIEQFPKADQATPAQVLLETLRFNAALQQPTAASLRSFLRDHPEGAHHLEAEARLSALELAEVSTMTDPVKLAHLSAENPDDPRSVEATAKLDELDWSNAVTAAKAYAYLREHPAGAHRDDAKTRLLSLQLQGLLVSGLLDEAAALAKKNPLGAKVKDLDARLAKAKTIRGLNQAKDDRIRRALAGYHLREVDDLTRGMHDSADPMDRWEAAEELGFHVTVRGIDSLLEVFRTARSPLLRQKAFDSLSAVLHALPHEVAEYEVATRVETLRAQASDAQLYLSAAVLLDVTGQLQLASTEYQRAWDANAPDPVVLRRWASLRQERRQFFSSAVAARQLAVWAITQVQNANPILPATALSAARDLCAVYDEALFAKSIIAEAKTQKTEFPEDLEVFWLRALEAERLSSARLRDAELAMLTENPSARRCGENAVRARFDDGVKERLAVIADLKRKPSTENQLLFETLKSSDPSPAIRAAVR